jgi:hypothetical protein
MMNVAYPGDLFSPKLVYSNAGHTPLHIPTAVGFSSPWYATSMYNAVDAVEALPKIAAPK